MKIDFFVHLQRLKIFSCEELYKIDLCDFFRGGISEDTGPPAAPWKTKTTPQAATMHDLKTIVLGIDFISTKN